MSSHDHVLKLHHKPKSGSLNFRESKDESFRVTTLNTTKEKEDDKSTYDNDNDEKIAKINNSNEQAEDDVKFDKTTDDSDSMPTFIQPNNQVTKMFSEDAGLSGLKNVKNLKDIDPSIYSHLIDVAKQSEESLLKNVTSATMKMNYNFKDSDANKPVKDVHTFMSKEGATVNDFKKMAEINSKTGNKSSKIVDGKNDLNFTQVEQIPEFRLIQMMKKKKKKDDWKKILPKWTRDLRYDEQTDKKYYRQKEKKEVFS